MGHDPVNRRMFERRLPSALVENLTIVPDSEVIIRSCPIHRKAILVPSGFASEKWGIRKERKGAVEVRKKKKKKAGGCTLGGDGSPEQSYDTRYVQERGEEGRGSVARAVQEERLSTFW